VGQFFSQHVCFALPVLFLQCSTLIFICTLLLREGQVGKTWEASKNSALSEIGALDGKLLPSIFSLFKF
jgi:hypothetical protein